MEVNDKIVEVAKKLIIGCMGMKAEEKLLIVADEKTSDLGHCFALAGRECGYNTTYIEAPLQEKGEPPEAVAAAMAKADVEFLITTMSYSHRKARIAATDNGARVASMPLLNEHICEYYLDTDYEFVKELSCRYANLLTRAKVAKIITEKGTDITFLLQGRSAYADTGYLHEKGCFGNLPAGEAYIAPIETVGTGRIVVDGCIAGLGLPEDDITLVLKDGHIVSIEGNKSSEKLKKFLLDKDREAYGLAELGIGTNPKAKIIGHPVVDEKVLGTIHIAFGSNTSMGGNRLSNIHYDCIINEPTVFLDGVLIIEKGRNIY